MIFFKNYENKNQTLQIFLNIRIKPTNKLSLVLLNYCYKILFQQEIKNNEKVKLRKM